MRRPFFIIADMIALNPLACLLLVSPLFFLSPKRADQNRRFLTIFIIYFLLDSILTELPRAYPILQFIDMQMNWEGKIFSYFGVFVALLIFGEARWGDLGLRLPQADSRKYSLQTLGIFTVLVLIYGFLIGGYSASVENAMFQLLMPSVIEELVYRGILLWAINEMLSKPFRIGKTQFGYGAIITSLLFGLWHGFAINETWSISINWGSLIITTGLGFFLALTKERTGSLQLPILLHILINLMPVLIGFVLQG